MFSPSSIKELQSVVKGAIGTNTKLSIRGGGSKDLMGAPGQGDEIVDLSRFCGIFDYDPAEMVLTAGAATPLIDIENLINEHNQMLAFEPFDHASIFGREPGNATIGGVFASGVSGSRRMVAGAARDHLLGIEAVSGLGQIFVGGGKVVKNVTGYDLPKLMVGSWGRLAALTKVTFRVLPRPRTEISLALDNLPTAAAVNAMATAMGSPCEITGAAHVPFDKGTAVTAFRIGGLASSVQPRSMMLRNIFCNTGRLRQMQAEEARQFWADVRAAARLRSEGVLWRVVLRPSLASQFISQLKLPDANWLMDWAGGLIWAIYAGETKTLRAAAASSGGHATLVRAPEGMRATSPMFHPCSLSERCMEERVRRAFDPYGLFETGRFLDSCHED